MYIHGKIHHEEVDRHLLRALRKRVWFKVNAVEYKENSALGSISKWFYVDPDDTKKLKYAIAEGLPPFADN